MSSPTHEAPSAQHESDGHSRQPEQVVSPTAEVLGPITGFPRGAFGEALGQPVMRHRTNGVLRVAVMRTTQQQVGNRSTQRLVAQMSRSWLLQRACDCGGTCEKCSQTALPPDPQQKHLVQMQADGEASPNGIDAAALHPSTSSGETLDPNTRKSMESHFGADFSDVRIHRGASVSQAADAIHADAYTMGRDVYFAEGKYQPQSQDGAKLLAHELTHTEQQAAGLSPSEALASPNGDVVIGAPNDPLEREAEGHAEAFARNQEHAAVTPDAERAVRRFSLTDNPVTNAIGSGVRSAGNYVGGKVSSGIQAAGEFIGNTIERVAPGATKFFHGLREFFDDALSKGLDGVFGGIFSSIKEKGIAGTLEAMLGSVAAGILQSVGGFVAGKCAAMGELAEHLVDVAAKLGGAAFDQVKKGFDQIKGTLDEVWSEYGAPALDWVKKKLKTIWQGVEDTAQRFWNWLKPLREGIQTVWDKVTSFLIEGRRKFEDWLEWIVPKAIEAWEKLKVKIQPYMDQVKSAAKVVGMVVLLLSPAGPFVVIGGVVYLLYQGVKALWDKWGKPFTQEIRQWWVTEGVPFVQNKLNEFKAKVDSVKDQVQSGLQQLYDVFMKMLGAVGVLSFLEAVKSAIASVAAKIESFKDKLHQKIDEWSQKLKELLAKASPYLQQIREFLRQTLLVALVGPLAFLDDGVWHTLTTIVNLAMRTPCLRELGGLLRVPAILDRLGRVRDGIKQAWEVIKNPGPLLEQLKKAIAPLIAKIEPEVRARVAAMSAAYTDREIFIQVSVMRYLGESLKSLAGDWWPQLKKIGGDLLWPWDEVGKDFMPMLHAFGAAISALFNLEISQAIDSFLEGMKKLNGIAGALSGWFMVASVLIGAALGALGFAFGPAGVATVGAGAAAGLEFAEGVGIGLLVIALVTEAAVIEKSEFDLRFQNPRIADENERILADQKACKAIAGSLMSVITIGALMLLGAIAAKLAKFFYSLVEDVPIVKATAQAVKGAKKKIGDFSFDPESKGGGEVGEGKGAAGGPDDPAAKAEEKGVPRDQFEREVNQVREKVGDPNNVHKPADPRYDAEVDIKDGDEHHTYDRDEADRSWCRHSDGACDLDLGSDVNSKVDEALKEKAGEKVEEPPEAPSEPTPEEQAKRAELEQKLNDLQKKKAELEAESKKADARAAEAKKKAADLGDRAASARGQERARLQKEAQAASKKAQAASDQANKAAAKLKDVYDDLRSTEQRLNPGNPAELPWCFAADTPVWTASGPRRIDSISPGDLVSAYHFGRHADGLQRVLEVYRNRTNRLCRVEVNGEIILATARHRFWVESTREWVAAGDLLPGMQVKLLSNDVALVAGVELQDVEDESTYNLSVETCSNYYVGPGVLVHNANAEHYNFGNLTIYEGTNPKFPDQVYIGQTDDVGRRQGEHRRLAETKLKDPNLTPEQREFYEFMKDVKLKERVTGLNDAQADWAEQNNIDIEARARPNGGEDVMNRREQVSRKNMPDLEAKIKADLQAQGYDC